MTWFRRRQRRKLAAGMALAATLVHVFFLSLHVAASAAFAMAGPAAEGRSTFLICGPAQAFQSALETAGTEAPDSDGAQSLSCPYCTASLRLPWLCCPCFLPSPHIARLKTRTHRSTIKSQ